MEVKAYLTGQFAKSEQLIKAYRDRVKGKISEQTLDEILRKHVREVVEVQYASGLTYVSDGMLNWHDLFRPIVEGIGGIEVNGLARWFDNNFFYKKPITIGELHFKRSITDGYIFSEYVKHGKLKAILPDPFTIASMSENQYYKRFEDMLFSYAEILAEHAVNVEELGVAQIQLSSPYMAFTRLSGDEVEMASEAVREIRKRTRAELLFHTFYGPASNVIPHALDFPVDVVGVDMTLSKPREITDYSITKPLCLGVLDGRNSMIEDVQALVKLCKRIADDAGLRLLHVAPNCEFEMLPYEIALRKTRLLGELSKALGEVE